MSNKHTVKWGILATGGIAETFTRDLLLDPTTRGVNDLVHTVVAAASSSSSSRAKEFLGKVGAPESAKAYGSYKELVEDPNVEIIYVATPHSHHFQNAMLCLQAGKSVLCEKAFTTNAKQAELLIKTAKEKNLFLMEAVWTRYFPLSIYIRETITSGRLGHVYRVEADNSIGGGSEQFDDSHRMVNPDLAGGALLDLGIYSLTWVFQCLYTTQSESDRKPPTVLSTMTKARTGVDESSNMLLKFPRPASLGGDATAIAITSMQTDSDPDKKGTAGPAIRIFGQKGEAQVFPRAFRPTRTRLVLSDGTVEDKNWPQPGPGQGSGWKNGFGSQTNAEGEGHGMFWEADEAGYALRDGRKEGRFENLEESLTIMKVMDEVRKQNGLVYPEKIESTKFPLDL